VSLVVIDAEESETFSMSIQFLTDERRIYRSFAKTLLEKKRDGTILSNENRHEVK
jgi:hypothetical protein